MYKEEIFPFKILMYKDEGYWISHCLELDLIIEAKTTEAQAESEIVDIIAVHLRYGFENDNLKYMYHPAPLSDWIKFSKCSDRSIVSYQRDLVTIGDFSFIPVIKLTKCIVECRGEDDYELLRKR